MESSTSLYYPDGEEMDGDEEAHTAGKPPSGRPRTFKVAQHAVRPRDTGDGGAKPLPGKGSGDARDLAGRSCYINFAHNTDSNHALRDFAGHAHSLKGTLSYEGGTPCFTLPPGLRFLHWEVREKTIRRRHGAPVAVKASQARLALSDEDLHGLVDESPAFVCVNIGGLEENGRAAGGATALFV